MQTDQPTVLNACQAHIYASCFAHFHSQHDYHILTSSLASSIWIFVLTNRCRYLHCIKPMLKRLFSLLVSIQIEWYGKLIGIRGFTLKFFVYIFNFILGCATNLLHSTFQNNLLGIVSIHSLNN